MMRKKIKYLFFALAILLLAFSAVFVMSACDLVGGERCDCIRQTVVCECRNDENICGCPNLIEPHPPCDCGTLSACDCAEQNQCECGQELPPCDCDHSCDINPQMPCDCEINSNSNNNQPLPCGCNNKNQSPPCNCPEHPVIYVYNSVIFIAFPGGEISGASAQTVRYGFDATPVTAVPNYGHEFVRWSDGSTYAIRHLTNVRSITVLTAEFARIVEAPPCDFEFYHEKFQFTRIGATDTARVRIRNRSLETVRIPSQILQNDVLLTVTEIDTSGFAQMPYLRSVRLSTSVTRIHNNAFADNPNLREIYLSQVQQIGNNAFVRTPNLRYLIIPTSVQAIGSNILRQNEKTTIHVQNDEWEILLNLSWNLKDIIDGTRNYHPVVFNSTFAPQCVTELTDFSFTPISQQTGEVTVRMRNLEIEVANIPSHVRRNGFIYVVTEVATLGFANHLWNLTEVRLPSTIRRIGMGAFSNNPNLEKIYLNEGLVEIGSTAFMLTPSLRHIVIPKSVEVIGHLILFNIFNETPDHYTTIHVRVNEPKDGWNEMWNWRHAANEERVDHPTLWGSDPRCQTEHTDLTFLWAPKGRAVGIGNFAAEEIVIPSHVVHNGRIEAVTVVFSNGFSFVNELRQITLPNTITHIADGAFMGNANLESIVLPESLVYIGHMAFAFIEFDHIIIPEGVETIGAWAFVFNENLTIHARANEARPNWHEYWNAKSTAVDWMSADSFHTVVWNSDFGL
ncbi:MAG: leucine-rich repeat protein [Firmicutes bacterium]|nr:leucine-rich repeat protein [Bacillota bacterium]